MTELLLAAPAGSLEVRARADGTRRLEGRFPYNSRAVLSDGGRNGRPKKESFASRAFGYRVEDRSAEIHFLAGHRYDKPLASKSAGTLKLNDGDDALEFEARILADVANTTHGRDVLTLLDTGLAKGISPGFRLPPERAVPRQKVETITEEDIDPSRDMHGAIIRTIFQALLFELSIVTQPAYAQAVVEARHAMTDEAHGIPPASRWRR